jgi:hypothetical protein
MFKNRYERMARIPAKCAKQSREINRNRCRINWLSAYWAAKQVNALKLGFDRNTDFDPKGGRSPAIQATTSATAKIQITDGFAESSRQLSCGRCSANPDT